jgi:uncharacterized protein (DUF488 family)
MTELKEDEKLVVYTIGHSNRELDVFLGLLRAHGVETLADVRSMPGSRRLPQFNADALAVSLPEAGIAYVPLKALGGRKKPSADSVNTGWRHPAFRAYADYMATPEFKAGVEELLSLARGSRTAIMCAEAVPWRCHRNLVADALTLLHGCEVRHIMTATQASVHKPMEFARVEGDHLVYPADDLFG